MCVTILLPHCDAQVYLTTLLRDAMPLVSYRRRALCKADVKGSRSLTAQAGVWPNLIHVGQRAAHCAPHVPIMVTWRRAKYAYVRILTQFAQQVAEWRTSGPLRGELPGSPYQKGAPDIRYGSCLAPSSASFSIFFGSAEFAHRFSRCERRLYRPERN